MRSKKLLAAAAAALLSAGCATLRLSDSVLSKSSGNDPQVQLDFWHALATKTLISNDEGFHGVLLYLDGKDDATTYAQRVETLKSRGHLPGGFDEPADRALERGTLAMPLARSLNLRGGLTMRLTGLTPRYASRELEYRNIYPTSSTNQVFTGAEFVGVIGKAEDYRHGDPTNLPAAVMPPGSTVAMADDEVTPIMAMIAPAPGELSLQPTTTTAPAGVRKVVVTAVSGLTSVRASENDPWVAAKVGMELGENAEFRTGPTGAIQFTIPPDQVVSVDRLTTLKVLKAIQQNGKVTTDIGIKYGRTRYDLEAGGLEHQSTLRSPNATLAVRGTKVSLFDQPPFAPQAISLTGRAEFAAYRRRAVMFGAAGQGKTAVSSDSETAGDMALAETVVDPNLPGARTDSEAALLTTVISRGATVTLDRGSGIKIVRGGIPPMDAQLIPALPGRLNFVLRWDGDVDLNLSVSTPSTEREVGGEFVAPVRGLNLAPGGGKTAFDHRGGPNGGIEIVYFNKVVDGIYGIGGPSLSKNFVTATIDVFLDGERVPLFADAPDGGPLVRTTVTQTVGPNLPALASAFVNVPPPSFATAQKVAKSAKPATVIPQGPLPVTISPKKR